MTKKILRLSLLLILAPVTVILAFTVFAERSYLYLSLIIIIAALAAMLLAFEKRETDTRKIIIIAVMCVLSVVGRLVFAFIPGFKPVTAIVILLAVYFGGEAGFMCGAMTALLSNFYFGQGPWTPFQMLAWGLIGLFAGICGGWLKRSRLLLCIYGVLSGVAYSLMLDIATVEWYSGSFSLGMYIAKVAASLPFTVMYAVSNVIFLLLLAKPIGRKAERLINKFGM